MRRLSIALLVAVSVIAGTWVESVRADELEQGLDLKFRQSRIVLSKAGAKLRKGESVTAEIDQVRKLAEDAQADGMLLAERFRLLEVKASEMGGSVAARQKSVTEGFAKALEEYLALIAAIPPDGNVSPATLSIIDKVLDRLISRKNHPLLGNLPYRHPSFPPKEPDQSASIIPAYQNGNSVVDSQDTAPSPEAEISPAVGELAKSLGFSPVLIYEWVKNNVDSEWYWGCMKGAEETLRQKSGNDCDQAALLTALLRASGFPTRYVHGVMEFFPGLEVAKSLTGIDDPVKLALYLQRAGIPHKPVIAGGRIANIQMEHVWVESRVPYANYRGAVIDNTGKIWVALDTHIKASGYKWTTPAVLPSGVSLDGFRDGYLSAPRTETPLEYVRAGIGAHLSSNSPGTTYQHLLKTRTLNSEVLNILPASLQFRPVSISAEYAQIPVSLRHAVRFTATAGTRELFSVSLDAFRLAGKKTVLAYEPESVEDQMTIDSFGGLDNTPAYLVRLRPVLKVNDERVVVGQDGLPAGSDYNFAIEAVSPNGVVKTSSTPIAGNISVMLVAAQRGVPDAKPEETDTAETLLFKEANSYVNRWSRSEDELAALLGVALSRPVPIVATVGNLVDVSWLGDTPQEMKWKGVFLDANLRGVEVVGHGGSTNERTFMRLSGLEGSILENRVFEDDFQVESISTAKLFQTANGQGVPFITIDRTNLDAALADLSASDTVKGDIRNGVQQGLGIRIPQVELTVRNWSGTGYIKENPESGEAGWMLSGMVAGGMSVISTDTWNEKFFSVLKASYTDAPNRDPESAAVIMKISATDLQFGPVGEILTTPLQVMVKDINGKPVANVPITFTVRAGGGFFSDWSTSSQAKTDGSGIASADFRLGRQTGDNPVYFTEKGDTYVRQYGGNIVDASLASGTSITSPFTLYGKPGKASKISKLHGDGKYGDILAFAGFVSLAVEDTHGNPVSNIPVTFTAEAPVEKTSCTNPNQDTRPAMLFKPGDPCLSGGLTYSGLGACSTAARTITGFSSVHGASVQVVLGGVPGAGYPVKATVRTDAGDTLSETFTFNTFPFGNCSGGSAPERRLITSYVFPADEFGNSINGAKSGTGMPVEAKIHFIKEGETEANQSFNCETFSLVCPFIVGSRNYEDTTNFQSSSVTFNDVDGKAQGNGRFTADYILKPGVNYITITGRGSIGIKERRNSCSGCADPVDGTYNGMSDTYMWVFGVDIKTQMSGDVVLDKNGYSRNDVAVTYEITPSEYKASTAAVFIYKGSDVIAAFPSSTLGKGMAVISHGFKFEPGVHYSAQVVLNYGSKVEIRGDKTSINFYGDSFNLQRTHLVSRFGPPLTDTSGTIIDGYKVFSFTLDKPNTVSVALLGNDLVERGGLVGETSLAAGEHRFVVNYGQLVNMGLDPGRESGFNLRVNFAVTAESPARSTIYHGRLSARAEGKMLGQPVVHDVLIPDGSLNLSREDFAFKGRGPQLEFVRSYTNQATPDERQVLGEGWSHGLDLRLRPLGRQDSGDNAVPDWVRNMEGKFFLPGEGEEGGIRWTSVSVNGGLFRKYNDTWYADRGRHGRLAETAEGFVFTAKDGTKYVYGYPATRESVPVKYIEDRNGNRMNFAYNAAKNLERVTDAVGRSCEFGYINFFSSGVDDNARLASVTCSDGVAFAFGYNREGYLAEAKRGARSEKYEYAHEPGIVGPEYNLVKATDSSGNSFGYEYYQAGEIQPGLGNFIKALRFQEVVKRVAYPDARSALFFYDVSSGNKRTVRDLRGKDTIYTLNFYGNPLKIEEPLGKTTLMTWSIDEGKPDNVMTSRTDARGYLTTFEYDPQGNVVKETDPYGKSIVSAWNQSYSLIESRTDRNSFSQTQTWQYDARGNLLAHRDGDGKLHSYAWYPTGEMESSTDPRLFKTTFAWDRYGNPESDTLPDGNVIRHTHDIRGRKTSVTDPNGRKTEYTWDALDHPATVVSHPFNSYALAGGSGNVKTTVYDAEGNLLTETDRTGLTLTYSYTPRDQVKTITRNVGGTKTFDYDGNGNLVSETDWKGVATVHTYDDLNRRDSTTDRNGAVTRMGYDLNGNLTSATDAEGRVTTQEYDKLNRLSDTWQPALAGMERGNTHYTYYDEADPKTNLRSETDQEGHTTTYEYNGRYLRTRKTDARQGVHLLEYDDSGNLLQETDEEGRITRNDYDNRDRLTAAHRKLEGEEIVTRYQYDRAGNRTHAVDPLGHVTETVYDEWNRPWKTIDPEGHVSVT
ncbi:MAG: transglutaminase domain-containing protein, partial [Geobacteraceae bacterium]|nr:transglutaminase domain-containing protein [Geobacteraceae bacterium]